MTRSAPVSAVLNSLSNILGRDVVDKTGLSGNYDLRVQWTPDENQLANFGAIGVPEGFGAPPPDPAGPTLFTALEEQLGLKLESQKGSGEVLVIDSRIDHPIPSADLEIRAGLACAVASIDYRADGRHISQVFVGVSREDDREIAKALPNVHLEIDKDLARKADKGELAG